MKTACFGLAAAMLVAHAAAPAGGAEGGWEYAELRHLHVPAHMTGTPPVGPGGQAPVSVRVPARTTVTLATSAGEVTVEGGWEAMAAKLKAPAAKDGDGAQRLRVLDRLGADGWEAYAHRPGGPEGDVWMLKRRKR